MIILISIYIIALEGVSPLIIISSLFSISLLVSYNGRNDLIFGVTAGLDAYNPSIYNLGIYNPDVYSLPV